MEAKGFLTILIVIIIGTIVVIDMRIAAAAKAIGCGTRDRHGSAAVGRRVTAAVGRQIWSRQHQNAARHRDDGQ